MNILVLYLHTTYQQDSKCTLQIITHIHMQKSLLHESLSMVIYLCSKHIMSVYSPTHVLVHLPR